MFSIYLEQNMGEKGLIGSKNLFLAIIHSWKAMLVDFNYEYQTIVGTVLYVGFTMLIIIVMLNLLISIVGNTYSEVSATKKGTDYKVKGSMLL